MSIRHLSEGQGSGVTAWRRRLPSSIKSLTIIKWDRRGFPSGPASRAARAPVPILEEAEDASRTEGVCVCENKGQAGHSQELGFQPLHRWIHGVCGVCLFVLFCFYHRTTDS